MSKGKSRKSRAVSGKPSEGGALRFLKIRHGDKRWLLAHTAIVAGTMGVAMIGAPSIAMAAPGCADTDINLSGYQQFNCNGILDPSAGTVLVEPSEDYQMFVDGTGDGEFIGEVSNPAVIYVDAEDYDGYIDIRDGAIIDNEDGDGFVLESAGYTEITNDGYISGGSEEGSVGFRVTGGGVVELTNNAHIEGEQAGVYVYGASEARLANHSYNSVMGGNGFEVLESSGYVEVDNEAGLTAGLTEDGVYIDGVMDEDGSYDEAVAVYNGDSGIIVGRRNGVGIYDVQEGYGEEADVLVDNEAYWDWDSEEWVEGGFIAGVNGNGVTVSDVYDDVEILNGGTRGQGINFDTITEGGIDPTVYDSTEDSLLLQPGGLFGEYSNGGLVPSRGIWGAEDGINISDVDDIRIRNTTENPYNEDGPLGGLIVGANGAGIDVFGSEDVDVWNEAGLIWGGRDGISLYEVDTATIRNADGTIMGYDGIGIDIGPSELWYSEEWMSYDVEIYNSAEDGPQNGGIIAGDEQAIRVVAHDILVTNGIGGAILGRGFDDDGKSAEYYGSAIIELYSGSEDMYGGLVQVHNEGLIASWSTSEDDEGGYLPHIDWYDELDFASTGSEEDDGLSFDLDAINSDIATYADFVWSGGADGSLFNDETDTALSEYGTGATALAISSLGMYSEDYSSGPFFGGGLSPGAGVDVYNAQDGVIIGRVALFGETEDFGYAGASVRNDGVWYVKDRGEWSMMEVTSEDFSPSALVIGGEDGGAEINNAGLIQSAFNSEEAETATFIVGNLYSGPQDFGYFNNGWARSNPFSFLGSEDYQPANGIMSLVDGGVGDTFFIGAQFNGSEDMDDGTSFIALDVDFGPGGTPQEVSEDWPGSARADRFGIYGRAWGHTGVIVNNLDPGATEVVGDMIQIGQALYDDTFWYSEDSSMGAFHLAQNQPGYIEVDGRGAIQDGLYAWYLDTVPEDGDAVGYYLVSAFGPQAVQTPAIITAAQGVWYETASVVADHVYGGHFPVAGGGGAGADLMVGASPMEVASAPETAIWGKISGSWTEQSTSVEQEVFPAPPVTIDTSFVQNTFSMLAGADFQPMGSGGPLRVGVFGGYVASSVDFDTFGASATMSGGTLGAYAAYTNGGFYVDGQAKVDLLNLDYSAPGGIDTDAAVTSWGLEANTGYRMDMGTVFIEPSATLAYVNTNIDDMSVGSASIDFSNGDSLRGGVGVTVGTTIDTGNDTTTELALLAKVWNEFEDANTVTISDGMGETIEFHDGISGVFGEVRGTATVTSLDQSLSGFVSAGSKFNEDFITVDAKLGVRKGF